MRYWSGGELVVNRGGGGGGPVEELEVERDSGREGQYAGD